MKVVDLLGKRFGKLLVVAASTRHRHYECLCDCGNTAAIRGSSMTSGNMVSCGCLVLATDLVGQVIGKWTVVGRVTEKSVGTQRYICRCACGTVKTVRRRELKAGLSRSCGCACILPEGGAARNALLITYKRSAERRNHNWGLSDESFNRLTKGKCYYCDSPPLQKMTTCTKSTYLYNGIDRVDNSRGYEEDNVVPCCKTCNQAKNVLDSAQFLDWVRRIYQNFAWEKPEEYHDDFFVMGDGEGGWIRAYKKVEYIPIEQE